MNGYKWELYDITEDWTQNNDVAKANPAKLKELQDLFVVEAAKYQVFPLDNSMISRMVTPRPSLTAGRTVFEYRRPVAGIPHGDAPSVITRSYTITAEVDLPKEGAEGMLNTNGGRFGGYGLYLLKGKPVFVHNLADFARFRWEGKDVVPAGKHTIEFEFTYDGPGVGKGGTGVLKVDGKEVAMQKVPGTTPFIFQWDETFDVGSDTGTPVDDKDYKCPFVFTGKLEKLTVKLGPNQSRPTEKKATQKKIGERD
jgi:arylsulfatase